MKYDMLIALIGAGLIGCVLLLFLMTRKRKPDVPLREVLLGEKALRAHAGLLATRSTPRGQVHLANEHIGMTCARALKELALKAQHSAPIGPETRALLVSERILLARAQEASRGSVGPLPAVSGRARIALLARDLLSHTDAAPTRESLTEFFTAYQEVTPLTVQELRCLPTALRSALVDLLLSLCARAATQCQYHQEAEKMATALCLGVPINRSMRKKLFRARKNPGFLAVLAMKLQENGSEDSLDFLDRHLSLWDLKRKRLVQWEASRQAVDTLWIQNALGTFYTLETLDWDAFYDIVCPVHQVLRQDEIYETMDEPSKAYYRKAVIDLARKMRMPQTHVAKMAIALSKEHKDSLKGHVGYYLIDDGRARIVGKAHHNTHKRGSTLFLSMHALGILLLSPFGIFSGWNIVWAVSRWIFSKTHKPTFLPRISMEYVGQEDAAMVVMPILLTSAKQARAQIRKMQVTQKACGKGHIAYTLLTDLPDSNAPQNEGEDELLLLVDEEIRKLNTGHKAPIFFHYHRPRTYNKAQGKWMGYERKRGALMEFLKGIQGQFRYAMTLDADTVLPPMVLQRLIGTLKHPLHQRQENRGYAILCPRMGMLSEKKSNLARLYGGEGGVDTYVTAVSDVYQDVCGEGIFSGKGLLDIDAFLHALNGKVKENTLLSHDLLESCYARAAQASDQMLYDTHPQTYKSWETRLHRWTRGDWQLLPYLGKKLSALSKYKIVDNLRRSITPAILLLALSILLLANRPLHALYVLFAMFVNLFIPIQRDPKAYQSAAVRFVLWPQEAFCCLDAALRSLYRVTISHKNLLSWVTAEQAESAQKQKAQHTRLLPTFLFSAALLLFSLLMGSWIGLPFALLWFCAPFIIKWLDEMPKEESLARDDSIFLSRIARNTWAFFEKTVTARDHFLPPDNLQIMPDKGLAHRTSPTNIGLYLLSCYAAWQLGFIEEDDMITQMSATMNTVERLPLWDGHFFNWYDTTTLCALPPSMISSVDSGNLAACLLCVSEGIKAHSYALHERMEKIVKDMDFSKLYHPTRKLFAVGLDARDGQLSGACYDLLASESRILSYLAIAKGDAPLSHWRHLGRPLTRVGDKHALLSWSGTLFEYLMPSLLLKTFPDTLLEETMQAAVIEQQKAGSPWGISESGYYHFDLHMNYQYKAFGMPNLALKGEEFQKVIAPYAGVLALMSAPNAAIENLRVMEGKRWVGPLGFYEAVDLANEGALVKSHMAHHQGMALCALCNALLGNHLVNTFHARPEMQALETLLMERTPQHRPLPARKLPKEQKLELPPEGRVARSARSDTWPPDTQLLWGADVLYATSARGGGYAQTQGKNWNRFRPDAALQQYGFFFTLQEANGRTHRLFGDCKKVLFDSGSAVWEWDTGSLNVRLTAVVSPEDGALYHLIDISSREDTPQEITITSYFEVSLAKVCDDIAHPSFNNLFVTTSYEDGVLCALRRSRESGKMQDVLYHSSYPPAIEMETSRECYIGRARSIQNPIGEEGPLGGHVGAVLDPCMALRVRVTLEGSAGAVFVTSQKKQEATREKGHRALHMAKTHAKGELALLGITPAQVNLYQKASGFIVYAGKEPTQALWPLGISGDVPLVLCVVKEKEHLAYAVEAIGMVSYWQTKGLLADLALLCEEKNGYETPLSDALREYCALCPRARLLKGETLTPTLRAALHQNAALLYEGPNSLIRKRVTKPIEQWQEPSHYPPVSLPAPPSPPAVVIDLVKGQTTPAPWSLVLAGETYGCVLTERGGGYTFEGNSRENQIVKWSNDIVSDPLSEAIYVRDEMDGVWNFITPTEHKTPRRVIYEPGCATFQAGDNGILQEMRVFVDIEHPVKYTIITLTNPSMKTRALSVTYYVQGKGKAAAPRERVLQSGDRMVFLGLGGSVTNPQGMQERMLRGGTGKDCTVLQVQVTLPPMQSKEIYFTLGKHAGSARDRLEKTLSWWKERLAPMRLHIADEKMDHLVSTWLPYQVLASRVMARAGLYQAGGAWGFRDQLQDMLCVMRMDPARARAHILRCAAHQFEQGDVQHWWHDPYRGVRTRMTDDLLFLPYVTAAYIKQTGDESILQEQIPFLQEIRIPDGQDDLYVEALPSGVIGSLQEHCMRAIDAVHLGSHGLPLMGTGDWNDAMNAVGKDGKGESVWLAFFYAAALRDFAPLVNGKTSARLLIHREKILAAAEMHGWDGSWYRRAYFDDGTVLGSAKGDACQIDLIAQSWAVLAGADPTRCRMAMESVWQKLLLEKEGILRLFTPPFTKDSSMEPGYIKGYVPGVRENGGQYTHAAAWAVLAYHQMGQTQRAKQLFALLMPYARDKDIYRVEPYVMSADVYANEQHMGRGGWTWYTGSAAWMVLCAHALYGHEAEVPVSEKEPSVTR